MISCSILKEKLLVIPVVTLLSRKLYVQERKPSSSRRSRMSAVKAEKAMKRITRNSVFLLWSEEDAVMNNSLPRFWRRINTTNGLVKKNHL